MGKYLIILWIPSIVLLFLPYTSGVSPWEAVVSSDGWHYSPYALLGMPFFLSIPVFIAQLRLLIKKPFSRAERAAYWLLSYAVLAAEIAYPGLGAWREGFSREVLKFGLMWSVPFAGALCIVVFSARKLNHEEAATTALQAAWIPNAIVCGFFFWQKDFFNTGWEIGAYLAAFTVGLYMIRIARSMLKKR